MESAVMRAALALASSGISVIPIKLDGTKAPAIEAWTPYESRIMAPAEIRRHFAAPCGLAIIGGAVSGNLEVIDVDDMSLYRPWAYRVEAEAPGLFERLVAVATPRPGIQLSYRHHDAPERNRKLAQALHTGDDGQTKPVTQIETRGQGGYAVTVPSPARTHQSGRPYRLIRGSLRALPTITAHERSVLLDAARALGTYVKPSAHDQEHERGRDDRQPSTTRAGVGDRPGDAYNAQARWPTILSKHGWHAVYTRGGVTAWRRPGKEHGISATTNHAGAGLLYVFSTNAAPFEPDTSYTPFAAYALLEHKGDFHAAASSLAAQGYGAPLRSEDGHTDERPSQLRRRVPLYVGAWRRRIAV